MGAFLKWGGIALGALAGVALAALAYVYVASEMIIDRRYPLPPSHLQASTDRQAIARGAQLVQAYGCTDCHGQDLHGAFIEDFAMTSRNLTRLAKDFSDTDFQHAIRAGLRPDGTSVAETMPI